MARDRHDNGRGARPRGRKRAGDQNGGRHRRPRCGSLADDGLNDGVIMSDALVGLWYRCAVLRVRISITETFGSRSDSDSSRPSALTTHGVSARDHLAALLH